jgi:hypothetical protein
MNNTWRADPLVWGYGPRVFDLPVPAPAAISRAGGGSSLPPMPYSTALRCSGLRLCKCRRPLPPAGRPEARRGLAWPGKLQTLCVLGQVSPCFSVRLGPFFRLGLRKCARRPLWRSSWPLPRALFGADKSDSPR